MKIDNTLLERLKTFLKENLNEKRLTHTYAVAKEAVKLADHYGEDRDKAYLAALFHDMYRNLSGETLRMYVRHFGLPGRYMDSANLAHSKIAAEVIRNNYDIDDEDVINAVSYHTTGRANMSLLEKIIFIADAIEPARNYAGVDDIRTIAYEDLDKACELSLEGTINYLNKKRAYIDKDTIDALDYLKGA